MPAKNFEERLKNHSDEFHPVVPFEKNDKLLLLDFSENNLELNTEVLEHTQHFIQYINTKLQSAGARYGIGGYDEHRTIYSRSKLFSPSPTTSLKLEDTTKAPFPGEGEKKPGYMMADPMSYQLLKKYAVNHRQNPTSAEETLWALLKSKQLENYKFRRQHIIGNFIADFVCLKKNLIIEIDGFIHQLPENIISDAERTEWLKMKGFHVIRFINDDILFNPEKVLSSILSQLNQLPDYNSISHLSSPLGGQGAEPRRLHLGIDIWGKPYTKVMAPLDGMVHSFAFNNAFGDYGATIILTHNLDGQTFHTLYGHLSLNSFKNIQEGDRIQKGDVFAEFGIPFENGQWPPHLHFQLIIDMQKMKGDYPGVCKFSERKKYLSNCPNPDLILQMMQYASK